MLILIAHLLPQVPPQPFEHVLRQGVEQQRACFLLLGAVLVAPLSEEIFFRGLIYGWLRQYLKPALAYAAGGLIFGLLHFDMVRLTRSEERRVGKECRSRWSPYH